MARVDEVALVRAADQTGRYRIIAGCILRKAAKDTESRSPTVVQDAYNFIYKDNEWFDRLCEYAGTNRREVAALIPHSSHRRNPAQRTPYWLNAKEQAQVDKIKESISYIVKYSCGPDLAHQRQVGKLYYAMREYFGFRVAAEIVGYLWGIRASTVRNWAHRFVPEDEKPTKHIAKPNRVRECPKYSR